MIDVNLEITLPHMHPIAFHLGDIPVYWYGIFMATGFLLGFWTAAKRAVIRNESPEIALNLGPWLVIGALAGARIWYVVSFWDTQFKDAPFNSVFMIRDGGLVFHGGLIGALLAGAIYCKLHHASYLKLADIMAPSVALGHTFGRLGCFMTGCCYGRATDLPWGVHFPDDHATHGEMVHPAQIYSSLLNLALYFLLAWFYRKSRVEGMVISAYLLLYSGTRLLAESFRGDSVVNGSEVQGWSPGESMSLIVFVMGLVLAAISYFRNVRIDVDKSVQA